MEAYYSQYCPTYFYLSIYPRVKTNGIENLRANIPGLKT